MKFSDRIPDELLWQEDGHASDIAITALADGQDEIIEPVVRFHVSACGFCTSRVGEAVLLSLDVGTALQAWSGAHYRTAASEKSGAFPIGWIAGALVIAAGGLLPSVVIGPIATKAYWLAALHTGMIIVRAAPVLWNAVAAEYGRLLPIASGLSVITLVLSGLILARSMPRKVSTEGGLS
jgi:hypothetical protein